MMDINPVALLFLPVIIFSLVCHEIGHAWVAWRGGDDTAARQGRLSLNPLVHLDPFGTLFIVLQVFTGLPLIGWAKPVPVNANRLRSKKWDLYVSLGGVAVNLALIAAGMLALKIFLLLGFEERLNDTNLYWMFFMMLQGALMINAVLMVFNLLPIPPLDGSHVFLHFIRVRDSVAFRVFEFLERFGFFILIILLVSGLLHQILLPIISVVLNTMALIFFVPRDLLIFL